MKDARGLVSASVAQAIIEVKAVGGGNPGTPPVIEPPPVGSPAAGQGRFGGSFGSSLALLGLMLAALRRRR